MDNFDEFKPTKRQTMEMAIKNILGVLVPKPLEEIEYKVLPIINANVWIAFGGPSVMPNPPIGVCAPTVKETKIPRVVFIVFDKSVLENQDVIEASKSAILNVSQTKDMTIVAISGTSFDNAITSIYRHKHSNIENFIKRALSAKTDNPVKFCVNIPKLFEYEHFRQSLSEELKKINITFNAEDIENAVKGGYLSSLIITYKKLDSYNISNEEYDYLSKIRKNKMSPLNIASWDFMDRIFENIDNSEEERIVKIIEAR